MSAVPSMPVFAQLGMDASSTTPTEAYEFKSEGLASDRTVIHTAGMRGSRSQVIERVRQGTQAPGGPLVLEPSPTELRHLLPRILGAAESGGGPFTYALAETLPSFVVTVDRVAKVFSYTGCKVDRATFRASQGGPLELTLDIEALTESIANAGTFPSLTIDGHPPFVLFDGVLTLGGNAIQMQEVELIIDNRLKKDRFVNSQTRTDLPAMDRVITLRATVPYTSDTVGLYDGGASGVTCDLNFTYGTTHNLHFQLQNAIFPARKSPTAPSKEQEITMLLEGQVYKTGGTSELSVSLTV